ncbi:hypothetical protein ACFFGV_15660 [Pontibacillus salicampi]|uniref:ABC transporter ATP-binding protein n=1 Tax=Pontibacillus salicampi TaxID=1449801 RepID=A0ABV6LRH1_9BACI
MHLESKYLIRWGIPGWIVIFYGAVLNRLLAYKPITYNNVPPQEVIVALLTAVSIGVIAGYLVHQIYFAMDWILLNRSRQVSEEILSELSAVGIAIEEDAIERKYFQIEYMWQSALANVKEKHKMDYLAERYAYLLTRTHELGILQLSLIICLAISCYYLFAGTNVVIAFLFLLANVITCFLVTRSKTYYSKNAQYFMTNVLKDLLHEQRSSS